MHSKTENTDLPAARSGPLKGIKVVEIESMGPGPFAAMALADLGANVLTVSRPGGSGRVHNAVLERNRAGSVTLDMKNDQDKNKIFELVEQADVVLEGFRPGVMERLGLGPEQCLARNPQLVYGRITGWGRSGDISHSAGHDINYIALSGALHAMGSADSPPMPPLNLVGDYGGGGLMLAMGVVCALLESKTSGQGQIVDTAMIDGSALLMAPLFGRFANDQWSATRATNLLDGSAYFYRCYTCADGEWMSVGAIELPFRKLLLEKLELGEEIDDILSRADDDPKAHARLAEVFISQTREHWDQLFTGTDACVAPVLSIAEAGYHPHNQQWGTFKEIDGNIHPMPTPRFSRTNPESPNIARSNSNLLSEWDIS